MTRAVPDVPDHITREVFDHQAFWARARGDALKPDTPMNCYSIAALEVWAIGMDRLARGEGTFEREMKRVFREQKRLTKLYGVEP